MWEWLDPEELPKEEPESLQLPSGHSQRLSRDSLSVQRRPQQENCASSLHVSANISLTIGSLVRLTEPLSVATKAPVDKKRANDV